MSSRSSAFRNLLGGMLGGGLGILASAYFNEALMFVAVLVGVSVGWCNDFLWRRVKNTWPMSQSAARTAYQLHWAAGVCVILINAHLLIRIMGNFIPPVHLAGDYAEFVMLFVMLLGFFSAIPCLLCFTRYRAGRESWPELFRSPHRIYSRFMTRGPLMFFFGEVAYCFVAQLALYTFFVTLSAYIAPFAFGVVLFVMMPVLFILGAIAFLAKVALRRGSALCLATTLVITLGASFAFVPYAHTHASIWFLALLTGGCSGFATEAIRRTLILSRKKRAVLVRLSELQVFSLSNRVTDAVWRFVMFPWSYAFNVRVST